MSIYVEFNMHNRRCGLFLLCLNFQAPKGAPQGLVWEVSLDSLEYFFLPAAAGSESHTGDSESCLSVTFCLTVTRQADLHPLNEGYYRVNGTAP